MTAIDWNMYQIAGLTGALCVLLRYICVALDRLPSQSPWYYLTNLVAASLVMVSLIHTFNLAAVVVQTIYIGVSAFGTLRHMGAARQARATRRSRQAMQHLPRLSCDTRRHTARLIRP
ncbi:CBU_0592 family membrane protein [Pseudooceanicola sp. C21-150M6]|uniref:CBU_0592 family membrane protein n=1 Tax=Pseudooceanicola sp. C21-150M6 TaxID=3434355 RepID=UPI003D7FD13E